MTRRTSVDVIIVMFHRHIIPLQDHLTPKSLYPILVQSQASSRASKNYGVRQGGAPASFMMSAAGSKPDGGVGGGIRLTDLQPMGDQFSSESSSATDNLFEFTFEKRPFSSNAHYFLQVLAKCDFV